jgi:hypothetical protein
VDSITFAGPTVRARLATAGGQSLIADVPTHEWLTLGIRQGDPAIWSVRQGAPILLPAGDG